MIPVVLLFPPTCSCSMKLGALQKNFEDLTNLGLKPFEAATKLGLIKMCCRSAVLNCPMYFIHSTNQNRITDRRGHITRSTEKTKVNSLGHFFQDTDDIPLTRNPPNFPLLPGEVRQDILPIPKTIPQGNTSFGNTQNEFTTVFAPSAITPFGNPPTTSVLVNGFVQAVAPRSQI